MAMIDDVRPPRKPAHGSSAVKSTGQGLSPETVHSAPPSRYNNLRPHPLLQKAALDSAQPVKPLPGAAPKPQPTTPQLIRSTPSTLQPPSPQQVAPPVQSPAPNVQKSPARPVFDIRPPEKTVDGMLAPRNAGVTTVPVQGLTPQTAKPRAAAAPTTRHENYLDGLSAAVATQQVTAPARPIQSPSIPTQPTERLLQPTPTAQPVERPYSKPVSKPKARSRILNILQYPLIAAAALGMAYSSTLGQAIIGVYFVLAVVFKISSKVTFGVALVLLLCIPFFQVLHMDGVSENAAVYAYEMLVVGTVQAVIELWRDSRAKKHKHLA